MSGSIFFAVKSVSMSKQGGRKPSTLTSAARHNLREIQAELGAHSHIDSSRSELNEILAGPSDAAGVVKLAELLMLDAGILVSRLRRDYCQAVEIVFSLPPDTPVDAPTFFRCCVKWAADRFGANALLSAVAHYDEASPHAHVLISPIVEGRMRGSELINRRALVGLRRSFEMLVGRRFKLTLPPARLAGEVRRLATAAVLEKLERSNDGVLRSATWAPVRAAIEADPRPFAAALGVVIDSAPVRKTKTFVQIMTSNGRGPKTEPENGQPFAQSTHLSAGGAAARAVKPILCRLPRNGVASFRLEGSQQ